MNDHDEGPLDRAQMTAGERFDRTDRPLDFVRVRLNGHNGQALYIKSILEDEKDALFRDLADARVDGKNETDPEMQEIRTNLNHLIWALKDIESSLIELAGIPGIGRPRGTTR